MRSALLHIRRFIQQAIWQSRSADIESLSRARTRFFRVVGLTYEGIGQNQLLMRAAGLSYASLIGLGPLVALVVMISGSYLKTDPEAQIKEILLFVAPTLREYINVSAVEESPDAPTELDLLIDQIVSGAEDIVGQVNTGGGSALGIIGIVVLIFVGINLLTTIEKTFNAVWGVHRGRNWSQRIVSYWTFLSLGALLGLGSTALFSASTLAGFFDWLPFGASITAIIVALTPLLAILMLIVLLTFGYQFFPNTTVRMRPALIGATLVAIALIANNFLSIFYVQQVIRMKSFFGSLGILFVMMFGLYFFWTFVLVGAQLTYAIQNVRFLTHREVWQRISVRTQEIVTLAAFLYIARRFHVAADAPSPTELSERLRVPGNVLNTALELLAENDWITPIRQANEDGIEETYYRPSKPLAHFSLASFHETFANHGNSAGVEFLSDTDPLLQHYLHEVSDLAAHGSDRDPLDEVFENLSGVETADLPSAQKS